jgi:hypothetical protein
VEEKYKRRAIDLGNEDVAQIIAIDRIIEYIKQGNHHGQL